MYSLCLVVEIFHGVIKKLADTRTAAWTLKAIKYLPREQHHTTKLTSWALLVAGCFSAGGAPLGFCNLACRAAATTAGLKTRVLGLTAPFTEFLKKFWFLLLHHGWCGSIAWVATPMIKENIAAATWAITVSINGFDCVKMILPALYKATNTPGPSHSLPGDQYSFWQQVFWLHLVSPQYLPLKDFVLYLEGSSFHFIILSNIEYSYLYTMRRKALLLIKHPEHAPRVFV